MPDPAATPETQVKDFPTMEAATASTALASEAGWVRSQADSLRNRADDLHHDVQTYDLDQRAAVKARSGVPTLLNELAVERGMAWSDIARLVGVTVAAVRKWRRAEGGASAESRAELARLAAFLDLLSESAIEDPAQWMEMRLPLPDGYVHTPMDLYRRAAYIPLLDYASQRRTAAQVLDEVDPDWRDKRSDFEVYTESDGEQAFRLRDGR